MNTNVDKISAIAREIEDEVNKDSEVQFETVIFDLKNKINQLLFETLPSSTTIGDLDTIACKIYSLVVEEWEKRKI